MSVVYPNTIQGISQLGFGEATLAGNRHVADVEEVLRTSPGQRREERLDIGTFISNCEHRLFHHHPRYWQADLFEIALTVAKAQKSKRL